MIPDIDAECYKPKPAGPAIMPQYTPPPTGLEDIAKRYDEIYETMETGSPEMLEACDSLFTSEAQADQFFDWFLSTLSARQHLPPLVILEPTELKAMINSMDFTCTEQVLHLADNLALAVCLPVGTLNGHAFRLCPSGSMLCSDEPFNYETILDRDQLMFKTILAVKMDVPLAAKRFAQNDSESDKESVASSKQVDLHSTPPTTPSNSSFRDGIIVQQLGALQYYLPSCSRPKNGKLLDDNWMDTAFVVAMRICENGTQGGIYVIHNDNPVCDCGDRHIKHGIKEGGFLPTKPESLSSAGDGDDEVQEQAHQKIFCAKIATKFDELGHGKKMNVHPVPGKITKMNRASFYLNS